MCQVFGFILYGYVFGAGRGVCFMDADGIQKLAAKQFVRLGIGPKYAEGMMQHACELFAIEGNRSIHAQNALLAALVK